MHLSNARRWEKLCHQQANILQGLSQTFPERAQAHQELVNYWRALAERVRRGESLKL
ncbi:hypothetical protein SHLO109777_13685 [Shewanella loihica]|uniref:Uncharacterized protein n=1 Tax=Shewanella loihica (strain ATCC BAA-1088 / PV-4) TaxID=323850 RepID=A3QBI5_SHELP|nr:MULTISPECIES: hypothetical protein [Shewanella]ABO22833.1 conserved hypothetical protein [Shewanella loihica PV-4]QYJ83363.1 hypothetical protein K0H80_04860 [Shewanella aegiceratis]QYJ94730.1 hypothetical protein K0I31_04885 [Shewanella spartinae]QYJ98578.1 hypothetical protein K0J45_04875 [Shewanella alkalitolerans]QYK13868.1 hypothetical protein K0I63_04950 [Shewanella rhizosphaerae]